MMALIRLSLITPNSSQIHDPDQLHCGDSGFFTTSVTVDPVTSLVGSTTLYEDCDEFGVITDGTVSITAIAVITDPPACSSTLSFTVSFFEDRADPLEADGLSVNDGVDTIVIDGGFDFSSVVSDTDCDLIPETVTDTLMSANPLNVTLNGETSTLSDFNISDTVDNPTGAFTSTFSGTVVSTAAGAVSVMTTPAITGNIADTYPSSGQFTITTGSEILTVTINSNVPTDPKAVRISLDSDGDGTPDNGFPQDYSWDELVALV